MTWFIGIFTDILGTCGIVLGGIIVAVLAVFMVVCYLFIAWLVVSLALATVYAVLYYWPRYFYYKLRGKEVPPEPFLNKFEEKSERFLAWMDSVKVKLSEKEARMKEAQRQRE